MPIIHRNPPDLLDRSAFRTKMKSSIYDLEQAIEALHEEITAFKREYDTLSSRHAASTTDHAASKVHSNNSNRNAVSI